MQSITELTIYIVQVKSRMMGAGQGAYKGTIDCFVQTFKNDVRALIPLTPCLDHVLRSFLHNLLSSRS